MGKRCVDEADEKVVHGGTGLRRGEDGEELVPEVDAEHGDLGGGVGVEDEERLRVSGAAACTSSRLSFSWLLSSITGMM